MINDSKIYKLTKETDSMQSNKSQCHSFQNGNFIFNDV